MRRKLFTRVSAGRLWAYFPLLVVLPGLCASPISPLRAQVDEPVSVVFETDMGNSAADVVALSVLHALCSRRECRLAGVIVTKNHEYAAPMVDVVNTFYHRGNTPVALVRNGTDTSEGRYNREVVRTVDEKRFPAFSRSIPSNTRLTEAVAFLRKTLASSGDGSLVFVQAGFSTNFARLLETRADSLSPLNGRDLVAKKVKFLCVGGGNFDPGSADVSEALQQDSESTKRLLTDWPTAIVFCGRELGNLVSFPSQFLDDGFRYTAYHPVREACRYDLRGSGETPVNEALCVLYAIRNAQGYFDLGNPGIVSLDERGRTVFRENSNGKHRYCKLTPIQIARVREAIVQLATQPPIRPSR